MKLTTLKVLYSQIYYSFSEHLDSELSFDSEPFFVSQKLISYMNHYIKSDQNNISELFTATKKAH